MNTAGCRWVMSMCSARGGVALPHRSSFAATRSISGTPDPAHAASAEGVGARPHDFNNEIITY
jgi:hypothetical protein